MNFLIITAKIAASVVLFVALVTSLMKASPRFHSPAHPAMAEYASGFIVFFLACTGFYYLWW